MQSESGAASPQDPLRSIGKGVKMLKTHEIELLKSGKLKNDTHPGATSVWLHADSSEPGEGQTNVYRHMGDIEFGFLMQNNQLPDTQPYQTIVEGAIGRKYCEKYLNGTKWVDSNPTTVVEFTTTKDLVAQLFAIQHKPEDGCLSMGLGSKGGGGLPIFNASLVDGRTTWRVVRVKRRIGEKKKK
jgi:hypothetical protein